MRLIDYIFPPDCLGCGELLANGRSYLCPRCQTAWEIAKNRRIRKKLNVNYPFFRMTGYRPDVPEAIEDRLLMRLKYQADTRIVEFLTSELCLFIGTLDIIPADGNTVLAWIPRRELNVKRHGYDHMARLSARVGRRLGMRVVRLFERTVDAAEQKKLTAKERWWNAAKTIRLVKDADIAGKSVILLDDIATTGASLESAADQLMQAGAREVICVTAAVSERTPPEELSV